MAKLSKKDKITFSILKWIFNAIQKQELVERDELLTQLSKNEEIIGMLGYESIDEVQVDLYDTETKINGYFNWEEFLDFFLTHTVSKEEQENPWWRKLLRDDDERQNVAIIDRTEELKR